MKIRSLLKSKETLKLPNDRIITGDATCILFFEVSAYQGVFVFEDDSETNNGEKTTNIWKVSETSEKYGSDESHQAGGHRR